jgi:2-iminobutanoate/2-iminopropanoate deaminase
MRKVISTGSAPKAVGTYSQGITSAGLVFTSGQIGLDPATGKMVGGDFASEARQVLANLRGVLEAGGSSLAQVVKITVFLTDLSNFAALNEVFAEVFPSDPPARSTVQVAALPLGARVEIEAIGEQSTG